MSDDNRNSYEAWNPIRFFVLSSFINPALGSLLLGVLAAMLWQNWDTLWFGYFRWFAAFGLGLLEVVVIGTSLCQQMGMEVGSREVRELRRRLEEADDDRARVDSLEMTVVTVSDRFSEVSKCAKKFRCDRQISPRRVNTLLMELAEFLREARHLMVVGASQNEESISALQEKADGLIRQVNSLNT